MSTFPFSELSAEEIDAAVNTYESRSASDTRIGLGPLSDQVEYQRKRLVLKKHRKPVAALVPIEDLATLHALDTGHFAAMGIAADAEDADEEETLSLEEAARAPLGESPAATEPSVESPLHVDADISDLHVMFRGYKPSLIRYIERVITDCVVSVVAEPDIGMTGRASLRKKVMAGVLQGIEGAASAKLNNLSDD